MAANAEDISRSKFIRRATQRYLAEIRELAKLDPTALSDEEVEAAFKRIRQEYASRQDHKFWRALKRKHR